jgi:hypothetical protein
VSKRVGVDERIVAEIEGAERREGAENGDGVECELELEARVLYASLKRETVELPKGVNRMRAIENCLLKGLILGLQANIRVK